MKNNTFSRMILALAVVLMLSSYSEVFAAGTAAGTAITNQASVNYNAGSNARSATSNTLTIYVGQKIVIDYTPASATLSTVDAVTLYQAFSVKNSGNGTDAFGLTLVGTYGNWTASIVESGNDNAVTTTGSLAAEGSFSGRIKLVIPADEADAASNAITLQATSTAVNAGNIVVLNPGINQTFVWTVTIAKPVINFSVTPSYSANKIPGETQSYSLSVTNTGSVATSGTSTVTWKYDNTNLTSVTATGGSASSGTATWTIPVLDATTGSATLSLTAVIEQSTNNGTGVAYNTLITNGTTGSQVDYNDGTNAKTKAVASTTAFNVGKASGASWTVTPSNATGNPDDVVEYAFTLKNTGNNDDNYTLTNTDASGTLDVSHIFAETSGGSSVTSLTSSLAAGATIQLFVRVTVPSAGEDANTIKRNIIATTQTGSPIAPTGGSTAASFTAPLTTTVTAPMLTIVMSDSAAAGSVGTAANPFSGDVIYYIVRITNSGTGNATSVVSSNLTAHTAGNLNEYVANSVEVDADWNNVYEITPITDGTSFSGGSVAVTSGTVSVTFNTVPANSTKVYRYRVAIQ